MDALAGSQISNTDKSNGSASRVSRALADLPGPKPLPLIGNGHQIDSMQFHLSLENWAREFGSAYRIHLGGKQIMVLSDGAVIRELLRDRPDAVRRSSRSAKALIEVGTSGLFTAEGEEWRKQRKLIMRTLTPEVIRNFFPTMTFMTERLLTHWQAALAAGRPVNLLRDLRAYTLDVTVGLAMGQDINTLQQPHNPLQRDIEQLFGRVARRLTSPFPYWRYFKLPVDRAADACSERIASAVTGFIARTREVIDQHPERRRKPTNMLEALLVARDEPDSEFTDAHVIGNAITMVFAGEDTSSSTMAWLLNFIAGDPRVAANIAAETDVVLGSSKVLGDYAALDRFSYIEAVSNEAMRIKPVVPLMPLEVNHDIVVEGIPLPQGTTIFALLRHAGQDAIDFPQPDVFLPERWQAAQDTSGNSDPMRKLFPFGAGPRFCPGRFLGMAEIKMVVSMIARNFVLGVDTASPPVRELFTFTMTPSSLPVVLTART